MAAGAQGGGDGAGFDAGDAIIGGGYTDGGDGSDGGGFEFDGDLAFEHQLEDPGTQQAIAEMQQQILALQDGYTDSHVQAEAEQIVQDFPWTADPEAAQQVVGLARELAEFVGQPELANNPRLWRLTAGLLEQEGNIPGAQDLGDLIVRGDKRGRAALPFGSGERR